MIRLSRDLSAGRVHARFNEPQRSTDLNRLADSAWVAGKAAPSSTVWKVAKAQLIAESGGKCAYCEAPTTTVAHGDVEHFRPKDHYWWWAYCYFNYTYSCQVCNQTYTGAKFPLKSEAKRIRPPRKAATPAARRKLFDRLVPSPFATSDTALRRFRTTCRGEGAILIDPYEEEPEPFFKYEIASGTREVRMKPARASGVAARRARDTIDLLGLNREEIAQHRFRTYQPLELAKRAFEGSDPVLRADAETYLGQSMRTTSDYAGMCRHFVLAVWSLPIVVA